MALPPERLEELLPLAERGVLVEVLEEVERGPEIPPSDRPPMPGPIDPDPWQRVRIRVREVLFGPREPRELIVYKPENPYLLSRGDLRDTDHVMLLTDGGPTREPEVLGRYGPRMCTRDAVLTQIGDTPDEDGAPTSIGMAAMEPDGTIVLWLRAEGTGGSIGDAAVRYPRTDPRYDQLLAHLGGLEPGQEKPVRPFPE